MNERVRKMLVYLTLPIAVVWGAYNLSSGDKPESRAASTAQGTADLGTADIGTADAGPATIAAVNPQTDGRMINVEDRENQAWGQDPFRCYRITRSGAIAQSVDWTLRGILYNSSDPVAYINRQAVRVGDTVDKATVKAINRRSVIIDYRGREIELSVNKG